MSRISFGVMALIIEYDSHPRFDAGPIGA